MVKNDKVDELVEWVHNRLPLYDCRDCEYSKRCNCSGDEGICERAMVKAKQILSHPDLALIDRDRKLTEYMQAHGYIPVIPLAEAIKEMPSAASR